jgi:uncharacterized membrane protein
LPFVPIIAMIDEFFMLLAVREYTLATVKAHVVLSEDAHCINHLFVGFKVNEEPAFGVDEIVHNTVRDFFKSQFRLQNDTVESVSLRGWHGNISI